MFFFACADVNDDEEDIFKSCEIESFTFLSFIVCGFLADKDTILYCELF